MQINTLCISNKNTFKCVSQVALAVALAIGSAHAQGVFDQADIDFKGSVSSMGVITPGSEATLQGRGFTPGQEVLLLSNGQSIVGDQKLVANKDGEFVSTTAIPADAFVGLHPVVIQAAKPSAAAVFDLKISPKTEVLGADKFTQQSAPMTRGLYQSAYSPKQDKLYVVSSVGRPPVQQSELLKVNPETLAIEARITPAADPNRENHVYALYGVSVDDINGNIWVTTTRNNSVAVYKQSDLSLVKQFDDNTVAHSRDVVVDAANNRAYASAFGAGEIAVFDTKTLEQLPSIALNSKGRQAPSPMSLSLDTGNQKLYTVSINTGEAFVIDLKEQKQENVITLPGVRAGSGIAVAPAEQLLWVAAQGTDNVLLIDLKSGNIVQDVKVGAGPLNIVWDDKNKLAFVAVRANGLVTALNTKGEVVANLEAGRQPNHISTDGKGNLFVVHKPASNDKDAVDQVTRLHVK